jgi:hypothetical protein
MGVFLGAAEGRLMKTQYPCRDFDEISAIISAQPLFEWPAKADATEVYTV